MRLLMMLRLVIGQVHQRGEILAEADRIKDGEFSLPGGVVASSRKMMLLIAPTASSPPVLAGFKQQRTLLRMRQQQRQGKCRRQRQREAFVFRQTRRMNLSVSTSSRANLTAFRKFCGGVQPFQFDRVPVGEKFFRGRVAACIELQPKAAAPGFANRKRAFASRIENSFSSRGQPGLARVGELPRLIGRLPRATAPFFPHAPIGAVAVASDGSIRSFP